MDRPSRPTTASEIGELLALPLRHREVSPPHRSQWSHFWRQVPQRTTRTASCRFWKGTSSTRAVTAANSTAAFSRGGTLRRKTTLFRNLLTAGECTPDTSSPEDDHASQTASPPETEWCERRLLAAFTASPSPPCASRLPSHAPSSAVAPALAAHRPARRSRRARHARSDRQLQALKFPRVHGALRPRPQNLDYDPAHLDQLCLTGPWDGVASRRIRPRSKYNHGENGRVIRRRVIPPSRAIAFFVREDADWMRAHHPGAEDSATRS